MSSSRATRRKSSSLAQLSGSKAPPAQSPASSTSKKRKVQPEIKDRAEAFLSAAAARTSQSASLSTPASKRRKILNSPSESSSRRKMTGSNKSPKKLYDNSISSSKSSSPEKRPRQTRLKPPLSYLEKLERAQNQRMVVVERVRKDTEACPVEEISIVGTTGNLYKVTVSQTPSCTCPDFVKRAAQCKHIVYVLYNVLKAPEFLQYQLAFLTSELREIFANAPAIPTETSSSQDTSGKRKPVQGECPICYMDFDEEHNDLVWCKAACGQNIHKTCFEQWAASQARSGVRCVYCRTPWQMDSGDMKEILKAGEVNEEGYVNLAGQFGMSGERDYSSYHPFWVRRMGYA